MTIGPDMPLRSLQDAIGADTGKGNRLPDKKAAKGKDDIADFKSMLEAKPKRISIEGGDLVSGDEVAEIQDDPETQWDNEPASTGPSAQALFGQSILALEQLLERQKQGDGDPAQHPGKSTRAQGIKAQMAEEASAELKDDTGKEPASALPVMDKKSSVDALDKPAAKAMANPDTKPEPVKPDVPQSQPTEADPADAAVPKARADAKQAPEQAAPPTVNNPASAPSAPPPVDIRINTATLADASAALQSRPAITDVQIISDHSTSAARTLVIQLQPIDLGTVTARLRLTGEGMHIQLMAESKAAAEHLARDHEALGKALQRAGVADDTSAVTISVIDRSGATANTQSGQQNPTGQDQQAGNRAGGQANAGSQGTQGDRSSSRQSFGDSRPDESDDKTAKSISDRNLSGGLVV